jgi:rRNA processing protein Krr1/Pno1
MISWYNIVVPRLDQVLTTLLPARRLVNLILIGFNKEHSIYLLTDSFLIWIFIICDNNVNGSLCDIEECCI